MIDSPLLSFIVLSHNYENYIDTTIRSILAQTFRNFEVVIVDDASTDRSLDVIRSFDDDRIRLLVNDRNIGGAASYNRAVSAANGRYLVNLDADDWIAPNKAEIQLAMMMPGHIDISCTYAHIIDNNGRPHPEAEERERLINQQHDFNSATSWIGRNNLVRSTTMVDRSAHLRIGLDDPGMVRAPDYELWTRALRAGCRFGVLPVPLTYYRLHPRGVTFGDPAGTFRELCYAILRNIVPLLEAEGNAAGLACVANWMVDLGQVTLLDVGQWHRLLGMLIDTPAFVDFDDFRRILENTKQETNFDATGRRLSAMLGSNPEISKLENLESDLIAVSEARDFWHQQINALTEARDYWRHHSDAVTEARDYWHQKSDAWEEKYRITVEQCLRKPHGVIRYLRLVARSLRNWHR